MLTGFDFWVEGVELDSEVQASLERANSVVIPTAKVDGVEAAYWCRMPERNHLRWVLPYDEDLLLDAMARLHPDGGSVARRRRRSTSARSGRTACWRRCGTCRSDMEAADLVGSGGRARGAAHRRAGRRVAADQRAATVPRGACWVAS